MVKVILLLICSLIIFGINELSKYKTYNAKIIKIEDKRIIITDRDNNGKIINISNLNIGDNIKIIIKDGIKMDIAMTPKLLQNIKIIKVLENNLDNFI